MFDSHVLTRPGTVLLDSAKPDAENRWSWCFTAPRRVLTATTAAEVRELILDLEAATSRGHYVAGYLSYEAGYPFVDLEVPEQTEEPLAWFGVYDSPQRVAPADVEAGLNTLDVSPAVHDVQLGVSKADYTDAIRAVRRHIEKGNVYQINYTAPFHFRIEGDPRGLYRRLRARQRVPFGAYLNLGTHQILSCSPELFFQRHGDRVVTRPMKGTIRRGRTLDEDRRLREELAADPKNRAENLMIVDLLRNDLSVCCDPGTVRVPSLYDTEVYETVTQMTSTVEGRLQDGASLSDVLQALFPCGSVTGAPKRRAMRLIRDLEPAPRGAYCGAIGMVAPGQSAAFNVAIRTVVLEGAEGKMGVGSGIVWDSRPDEEYDECQLKGQFLTADSRQQEVAPEGDFRLIESMRWEDGQIPLLDRHVARLARSAAYFSFPFDEARFRRRLRTRLSRCATDEVYKVRATLGRWGGLDLTVRLLSGQGSESWSVVASRELVDRNDPFFYHKTTRRGLYDRVRRRATDAGYDEALLLNQEGEVTEGTISNVFVEDEDGLWTPPVDCGLLAGVYRQYVLDTNPSAGERVLTVDDLAEADGLYCCNAVRGWVRATLSTREVGSV